MLANFVDRLTRALRSEARTVEPICGRKDTYFVGHNSSKFITS